MNKALSWKVLLPLGVVAWVVSHYIITGVVADAIGVLATIILLMGVIDFFRNLFKQKSAEPV